MSGPLKNTRHEKFAQGIFQGKSQREAYRAAGYNCSDATADVQGCRLLKDPKVAARVEALHGRVAEKIVLSKAWVIQETIDLQQKAKADGAYGPSAKCVEMLAREVNTFIPKSEVGAPGEFSHLNEDELRGIVEQAYPGATGAGSESSSGARPPRKSKALH